MKALSLHPMYAAEIAVGDKPEEYRTWQTPHRGDLLICASVYNDGWFYPRGYALCVVNLYDIKWSEENDCYAWLLKDIRPIVPFPVKGKLHLYDVDDKLIKFADKSANKYLFDWWQDDLKIIVPPQKKKAEAPKQQELTGNSVSKKKKAEPPKQEETALQKRRRYRLHSVY